MIGGRRRILIPVRPQGVQPAQGQSSNLVFNPINARRPSYQNYDNDIGRTVPLAVGQSLRILPANRLRTMLTIQNEDAANDIRFRFGAAATATEGYIVPAGGVAFFDTRVPSQDVYLYSTLGSTAVWVAETCWQEGQI